MTMCTTHLTLLSAPNTSSLITSCPVVLITPKFNEYCLPGHGCGGWSMGKHGATLSFYRFTQYGHLIERE